MEPGETAGPTVLVIDDDEAIRTLLTEFLGDEGYHVSATDRPPEQLDGLVELEPDLIILDIMLHGEGDGLAFVDTLKADSRTRPIPILVCTAAVHLSEEIEARLTAADCVVVCKPFDLDVLLAEVIRCLEEHDLEPISA